MAKSLNSKLSFAAGEWSKRLDARVDQPKYSSAMRECLNMIPYTSGALTRRPGTEYISVSANPENTATHDYGVRLQSFIFSPNTTMVLAFGNKRVDFWKSDGTKPAVSGASAWDQYKAYQVGQYVTYLGLFWLCILPVTSIFPVGNTIPPTDTTHWKLRSSLELPTPYNSDCGSAGPEPGAVWDTEIWRLAFCQINDVIYIASPDFPVYKMTRIADGDWRIEAVPFDVPALLDRNATSITIAASATTGSGVTLAASAPAWATLRFYSVGDAVLDTGVIYTCIKSHTAAATFAADIRAGNLWEVTTVFQSGHIGSTWELAHLRPASTLEVTGVAATGFANSTSGSIKALGPWEVHTYGVWSSDIAIERSLDGGITWEVVYFVTGRSDRNVDIKGNAVQLGLYRIVTSNSAALVAPGATNPRIVFEVVDAFLHGLVSITAVGGAYSATATVSAELYSTGATPYWSEAAWSDVRGYPQAVASFQQRVLYGGSTYEPQRIWGSQTNDIENMGRRDPAISTDGFAFDLNAPKRGPIEWLIAQMDLFVGFSGAEWVVNSGSTNTTGQSSGAAITATNINAVEHSSWGSAADVVPEVAGDAVIYSQRQATSIRQMLFSIYTTKYMSADATLAADHLFTSRIAQMCYQPRWRKQGIIWAVTRQGSLCGMTYSLDQEVFGWHRHQTGWDQVTTDGVPIADDKGFESACIIDGLAGEDDQLWVVVNRTLGANTYRFIERVHAPNWEETFTGAPNAPAPDITKAWYVDCAVEVLSPGSLTISGIPFSSRYVVGLADGQPFGPLLSTGGAITLPDSFVAADLERVIVGLPIKYTCQPMRIDSDPRAGNTQALVKGISDVFIRLYNSAGGSISNGTEPLETWVSGSNYAVGYQVISPATMLAYQCIVAVASVADPSTDAANWAAFPNPTSQLAVPIPYAPNVANPFGLAQMITDPEDVRITPMLDPSPTADPQVIVTGNDALPITILALIYKYSIDSTP